MSKALDTADWGQFKPQRKNMLINPEFRIAQRGDSFIPAINGQYVVDRFSMVKPPSAAISLQRILVTAAGPVKGAESIHHTVTTAVPSLGTTEELGIQCKLEGLDVEILRYGTAEAKTTTLSFWTSHTKAGIYCVSIRNGALDRSYNAEYTQAVSNAWQYNEIVIPGDTTGTWATDNTVGLNVRWQYASGTAIDTPNADTWEAGNFRGTTNQVNAADAVSNIMRLAMPKLEIGGEATDFIFSPIADELLKCKRYYQKDFLSGTVPADNVSTTQHTGMVVGTTQIRVFVNYEVEMRNSPTLTIYQPAAGSSAAKWSYWNSLWVDSTATTVVLNLPNQFAVDLTVSGRTLGDAYMAAGGWTASAEI